MNACELGKVFFKKKKAAWRYKDMKRFEIYIKIRFPFFPLQELFMIVFHSSFAFLPLWMD